MTYHRLGMTGNLYLSGYHRVGTADGKDIAYAATAETADLLAVAPVLLEALKRIRDHGSRKECRGYPASVCLDHVRKIAADALMAKPG